MVSTQLDMEVSETKHRRLPKGLVAIVFGVFVYAAGVLILYLNPYWHFASNTDFVIDRRAYWWSGIGHLVSGAGLLCIVAGALVALCVVLGHGITSRWLYCSVLGLSVSILAGWLVMSGLSEEYDASFHWESGIGVTAFTVIRPHNRANPLWQRIVRSQIEPDLNGYLRIGGTLERTDGDVSVTVTRIVPIATPTALGSDGEALRNVKRKRR